MTDRISRRSIIAGAAAGLAIGITPAVIATPAVGQKPTMPALTERLAKAIGDMQRLRQKTDDLFDAILPQDRPGPHSSGPTWEAYFDARCDYDAAIRELFLAIAEQPLSAHDWGRA